MIEESPVEENMLPVMIILLMRNYDVLISLLGAAQPDMASKLMEMHERGEYFCPPPALAWNDGGGG